MNCETSTNYNFMLQGTEDVAVMQSVKIAISVTTKDAALTREIGIVVDGESRLRTPRYRQCLRPPPWFNLCTEYRLSHPAEAYI